MCIKTALVVVSPSMSIKHTRISSVQKLSDHSDCFCGNIDIETDFRVFENRDFRGERIVDPPLPKFFPGKIFF